MTVENDPQAALDAVNVAATVVKECLDAGMYTGKKCIPKLALFVELGLVVRTVLGLANSAKKDEVLEGMKELSNKCDKIDEKMRENFDDLKAFVSQYSFYNDVALAGSLLLQYLIDAMVSPKSEVREVFKNEYEKTPPLEYARRLNVQLSRVTTNPLKMLMAADPLKGEKTFEKWEEIYEGVMTQLCVIEAIACEMLNENNQHNLESIKLENDKFHKSVNKWRTEYRHDDHYWPGAVKKIVEDIQDRSGDKTSDQIAELIREKLETILTNDVLSIVVSREQYEFSKYANVPEQLVISPHRGNCHVFVFRSRFVSAEPEKMETLKMLVKSLSESELPLKEFPDEQQLKSTTNGLFRDSGFVLMLVNGEFVGLRSTKRDVFKDGVAGYYHGIIKPEAKAHIPVRDIKFFLYAVYK